MEWLGHIADIIGVFGAVFALGAWFQSRKLLKDKEKEDERLSKEITIVLRHGEQFHDLSVKLKRAEFSRAEILGRIGMIPLKKEVIEKTKSKRFSIAYTNSDDFLNNLNKILAGDATDRLTISCDKEEYNQFVFKDQ